MKILFVCRHNRFRSRVAEAYFNKINRNKNIKALSAGVFKGVPIAKTVKEIGKKLGIKISGETGGLKEEYLKEFDIVVIVANNVPKSLFKKSKKVIVWRIPDASQSDRESIEKIMKKIFKKIDELNKELGR